MNVRKKDYYVILGIVMFILAVIIGMFNIKSSKGRLKAENLVNSFYSDDSSYKIHDFKFNDKNSLIFAIVVFSKQDQKDESNILILTDVGTGVVNVGGGVFNFTYLPKEGINMISEDTLALSFKDQKCKNIYDYQIKYIINAPNDITYQVRSEIR